MQPIQITSEHTFAFALGFVACLVAYYLYVKGLEDGARQAYLHMPQTPLIIEKPKKEKDA